MRTAKQIFNGYKRMIDAEGAAYWVTEKDFITAINEARIEAVKKCADKLDNVSQNKEYNDKVKQSILNLINSIK